jgi:hypothetical protein
MTLTKRHASGGTEQLALAPVGEQHPADDVHLPQVHRPAAFPSLAPAFITKPIDVEQLLRLVR